jgi:hypothetical protein
MLVGLGLMGYTKFIQAKRPDSKIGIFFYIGIIVIVFGILREIQLRTRKPRVEKELVGPPPGHHHEQTRAHPAAPAHHVSPHASHQHVRPQQHAAHPYAQANKQCPRCHHPAQGQARFCHTCGYQFF